jgi:hypothetical protein
MAILHSGQDIRLIHPEPFSLLSREGGIYRCRLCPSLLERDGSESSLGD